MSLKSVALFGANGQIGSALLKALSSSSSFTNITALVPPKTSSSEIPNSSSQNVKIKEVDLKNASRKDLSSDLEGVDVVISALNGPALEAQRVIQDAAADVGVKRFVPSEFGFHQIYRKPDDGMGYIHEMWDLKARLNEHALLHPAIMNGKMSYTLIGCGDFYNQDRETTWCPWTQKDVDSYTIHSIGDKNSKAHYTHLDDLGAYLAAALSQPDVSKNASLNFPSDAISHADIAELLRKYSGKDVKLDEYSEDDMHKIIADPKSAPKELSEGSMFPVDFWFLVKGIQGQGRFLYPPGQTHNHLFPEVKVTTFEKYFQKRFGEMK